MGAIKATEQTGQANSIATEDQDQVMIDWEKRPRRANPSLLQFKFLKAFSLLFLPFLYKNYVRLDPYQLIIVKIIRLMHL